MGYSGSSYDHEYMSKSEIFQLSNLTSMPTQISPLKSSDNKTPSYGMMSEDARTLDNTLSDASIVQSTNSSIPYSLTDLMRWFMLP